MNVKLVFIVSTLRPTGPTNQLYYIIEHLDRERFSPTIVTLSPEPATTVLDDFRQLGVKYRSLGLSRIEGFIYGPRRLRSLVADLDPDVVHSQGIRADLLSAAFLPTRSRITTIRNYPYDDYRKFGRYRGRVLARLHLLAYSRLDCRIACSKTIANRLGQHHIDAYPIQNGIDHSKYVPVTDEQRTQLRKRLDLAEDETISVSAGPLISRKDPVTLIQGFLRSETADNGTLVLLGDGELREQCEAEADGNQNVRIEGYVDNVTEYLQAADCFVSASHSEGLPNAVMEALGTGLPVCLSSIRPHREILQYDARAGLMFDTGDVTKLAATLDGLVRTLDESRRESARGIVEEQLNAKRMSREYQAAYEQITAFSTS